jgi:malonate decarboxylase alpha subunit
LLDSGKIIEAMEELVEPGDRICLEGNNQEQADFLSRMLVQVNGWCRSMLSKYMTYIS